MVSLALTEPLWCIHCPVITDSYSAPFSRQSRESVPSKLQMSCFVAGGLCIECRACFSAWGEQQSDACLPLNEQSATKCMQPAV